MVREYFLGRPTPDGFKTHITDEIKSGKYFTYILKGGPGTGKSSLMRKIAKESKLEHELYYCSSDPDSLDAVVFTEKKIIIVDGTSPHVVEAQYPGVKEKLVDLGAYWNGDKLLEKADEIVSLSQENAKYHQRARRCLKAACAMYQDVETVSDGGLLRAKLDSFCERLGNHIFKKTKEPKGNIRFKQITSITPKGVITLESAFDGYKIHYIDDRNLAATDHMLKRLSILAIEKGYDCIVSENPLLDGCQYQHLIIPRLGLAFTSGQADMAYETKINGARFYDKDYLREKRERIRFDHAAADELINETVLTLKQAKRNHDELEKPYIDAMDFEGVQKLTDDMIKAIKER